MPGRFNPDHMIRERLFQKAVDRTGVSPRRAKPAYLRVFTIGIAVSYASYVALTVSSSPDATSAAPGAVTMLLVAAATIFAIRRQVAIPPHESFDFFTVIMRLVCASTAVVLTGYSIEAVMGMTANRLIEAITLHSMTISWIAAVVAVYLNVCREPPPPRLNDRRRHVESRLWP